MKDYIMLKFLFFFFSLLLSFNVNAVMQSAAKALSYRNIADRPSYSRSASISTYRGDVSPDKMLDPVVTPPKNEKIDLSGSDVGTVALKKNDTIEITLLEENGYSWKISPSSSSVSLKTNKLENGKRIVTYKMLSTRHSYIYFDYINSSDNSVVKSKQLTINLRD